MTYESNENSNMIIQVLHLPPAFQQRMVTIHRHNTNTFLCVVVFYAKVSAAAKQKVQYADSGVKTASLRRKLKMKNMVVGLEKI